MSSSCSFPACIGICMRQDMRQICARMCMRQICARMCMRQICARMCASQDMHAPVSGHMGAWLLVYFRKFLVVYAFVRFAVHFSWLFSLIVVYWREVKYQLVRCVQIILRFRPLLSAAGQARVRLRRGRCWLSSCIGTNKQIHKLSYEGEPSFIRNKLL